MITLDYQEKITSTITALETGQAVIIRGSDQHLDAILKISEILEIVTETFKALTEIAEVNFNDFTQTQAQAFVKDVSPIFAVAEKLMSGMARSGLDRDVPLLLEDFTDELRELHEMINDVSRFKANDMQEWNDIFND